MKQFYLQNVGSESWQSSIEEEQSGENQTNYFEVVDENRFQQIEMRTLKDWCFCHNICPIWLLN